jgi:hypothetical protein
VSLLSEVNLSAVVFPTAALTYNPEAVSSTADRMLCGCAGVLSLQDDCI